MKLLELIKMYGALFALMSVPPEQRDQSAIDTKLAEATKLMEAPEIKSLNLNGEFKGQFDQLRTDVDKNIETVRDLQRAGISVRGFAGPQVIAGREARLQMLADQRAFTDDKTAERFGAHMLAMLSRAPKIPWSYEDLPARTREIAEDVVKCASAQQSKDVTKADPDISPGVAGAGAELVANEFRAELIRNVEAVGTGFVLARRIPLSTLGQLTLPKRTGGLTAYPTSIAAEIQKSGMTFGTVQMTPVKWATLTGIPGEMFRDPAMLADVGHLIGVEIVYALAEAFDNAFVNGDGSATYGGMTGILNIAGIASVSPTAVHDAMNELDGADIGEIIAGLTKGYALKNAEWLMSLSVKGYLRNIRSTTGMPIYDRGIGGREPASIDGYPYTLCTSMPAAGSVAAGGAFASFGDFKKAIYWGMMRSIQIDQSNDVWFAADMVAIRGLVHIDSAVADSDAIINACLHA